MVKTTVVSDTNYSQTGKNNSSYSPYAESTRATIKYFMASPQEYVGGTQSPKIPGRDQRTGSQRAMKFSNLTEVTGVVRPLDRL